MIRTIFAALIAAGAALALLQGGSAATAPLSSEDQPRISQFSAHGVADCGEPIWRRAHQISQMVDETWFGDSRTRLWVVVNSIYDCDGHAGREQNYAWYLPGDVPADITRTTATPPPCGIIQLAGRVEYVLDDEGNKATYQGAHGPVYTYRNSYTDECQQPRQVSSTQTTYCGGGISAAYLNRIRKRVVMSDDRILYQVSAQRTFSGPGHACPLYRGYAIWTYYPPPTYAELLAQSN